MSSERNLHHFCFWHPPLFGFYVVLLSPSITKWIETNCHPLDQRHLCLSREMTKPTKWLFLHADSEDSDQTGRMPRLIWVFAGHTLIWLVLSCSGSSIVCFMSQSKMMVMSKRWVNLTALFLGRLPKRLTCTTCVSAHPFSSNLESAVGREWS